MADDEHGSAAVRPACGRQHVGRARTHVHARVGLQPAIERGGGLLRARRRTHQDPAVGGKSLPEPARNGSRLLAPAGGQFTRPVGRAVLGLRVPPEQEVDRIESGRHS